MKEIKNGILWLLVCILAVLSFFLIFLISKNQSGISVIDEENIKSPTNQTREESELSSTDTTEEILSSKEQVEKDIEAFLLTKDQEDSWLYEITTPTGEPDRKNHTEYVIVDSTGDNIPELHVRNERDYYVFSFIDGEKKGIYYSGSSTCRNTVLKDGTIVCYIDHHLWNGVSISFYKIDQEGDEYSINSFYWEDINSNDNIDVDEDYFHVGSELVEFHEWKTLCEEYIDIDTEKSYRGFTIKNEAEWIVLQEAG